MKLDTVVVNGSVVLPGHGIVEADLGIEGGRIVALQSGGESLLGSEVINAQNKFIFPGLIEPHSHIAYHDPLEDYRTETRAAALGGYTTMQAFFREATGYHDLVPEQIREIDKRAYIDFCLHLGCLIDEHLSNINHYVKSFGVVSYKFYMGYKGVKEAEEFGLIGCDDGYLYEGMREVAKHPGASVRIHAENPEIVVRRTNHLAAQGMDGLPAWTDARPDYAEAENVHKAIFFARLTDCPLYVVHVSSAMTLEIIRNARPALPGLYAETCPHYLTLTRHDSLGNLGKVNPPLRDAKDCEALWQAIADGVIDTIGTDHAAITSDRKAGTIWDASPGVGQGMGTALAVMLTEGYHKGRITLEQLARLMSYNPARIAGLFPRKGTLVPGADADLTIVDADMERIVRAADLGSAGDFSVYAGRKLKGWPVLTMVRGRVVMRDGVLTGNPGWGKYLRLPL